MNENNEPFPLCPENSQSFGSSGAVKDITSNLAFDKYQGLLAYGTAHGSIKIFQLKGLEKEILGAHGSCPIEFLQFVPRKLLLVAIDAENRLFCHDLSDDIDEDSNFNGLMRNDDDGDFKIVDDIESDKVSQLYMAPFLTSEEQNHKHLFIGMTSGSVHIFDVDKQDFTNFTIRNKKQPPNPNFINPFKVTDLKCDPYKMHRLLVAHCKSHVQVYSLNKQA